MHADGRLVEDVGHVGERRPEVADHLGALCLAARERPGRPLERKVAQPDLHERVERVLQRREQRRHGRLLQAPHPLGELVDLHRARVGDADLLDLRRPGGLADPGAVALGAGRERHRAVHERADVRLHGVGVLGQEGLLDLGDEPRVGEVDPLDLDLGRLLVEQVVPLALVELADRLVRVEEAAAAVDAAVPAVHAVARDRDRTLVDRLGLVVQGGEVEVGDRAPALATLTHAAGTAEGRLLGLGLVTALDRDPAATADGRDVERERARRADVRLPEPAEEDAQHRVGVGGGADGRAWVGAHPLLIDDDRRRQAVEHVDLRAREHRHEALHERAVGLVDQPLRLRGDRAEHQRALARAGDSGERRQPALRDLDADVLEVVHARALHADQIVAVGIPPGRRLRVRHRGAHWS